MYSGKELFHVQTYLVIRLIGTEDEIEMKMKLVSEKSLQNTEKIIG